MNTAMRFSSAADVMTPREFDPRYAQRPVYIVMVGLPGAGKSTLRGLIHGLWGGELDLNVLSTDDIIEKAARVHNSTYSGVFEEAIGPATEQVNNRRLSLIHDRANIIHDQTNLSPKKRRGLLASLPAEYLKIAIVCYVDEQERDRRLFSREGKQIPPSVDVAMCVTFSNNPVTLEEGFDAIVPAPLWTKVLAPYLRLPESFKMPEASFSG